MSSAGHRPNLRSSSNGSTTTSSWAGQGVQQVFQGQSSSDQQNQAFYNHQQSDAYQQSQQNFYSSLASSSSGLNNPDSSNSLPNLPNPSEEGNMTTLTTNSGEQRRIQINSCFVCNDAFVTENVGSMEDGLKWFQNLCNMLQMPISDEFLPESNPLCKKCCEGIQEFFKLQRQIQGLINMLEELRKAQGKRLVETYVNTCRTRKNYQVKTKIYDTWLQVVQTGNPQSSSALRLEESFATIVNSLNAEVPVQLLHHDQPEGDPSYSLMDISNASVSNHTGSAANSTAGNFNDDGNSQDCLSPASVGFQDDGGGMSDDENVYVKNLNDEVPTTETNTVATNNSRVEFEVKAVTSPSLNANPEVSVNDSALPLTENAVGKRRGGRPRKHPVVDEANWVDKRKNRPIVVTKNRSFPCKFCGKLFPSNFALEMHIRTHTGEKPFKCKLCSRGFNNRGAMLKHEGTHDKSRYEGEPQYECDICGKKYHIELSLYTHKRDHLGLIRSKRYRNRPCELPCDICGKICPTRHGLADHKLRVHKEKKFKCEICGKPFSFSSGAVEHAKTHNPRQYFKALFFKHKCPICPSEGQLGFSTKEAIAEHWAANHNDQPLPEQFKKKRKPPPIGVYVCKICPEVDGQRPTYKNSGCLWSHNKHYHSDIPRVWRGPRPETKPKEIKLDLDGNPIPRPPKKMRTPSTRTPRTPGWRPRPRRPLGERGPGTCSYCGKTFQLRCNLEIHVRTHTGEKPYNCTIDQCKKSFACKGNLDKHIRSHDMSRFEGEPKHVCDFCGKAFYVAGTLYHHRRKKHLGFAHQYVKVPDRAKNDCECTICGKKFTSMHALYDHRVLHGTKNFSCSVCGKPFFRHAPAKEHVQTHNPESRYKKYFKYQCSGCPSEALGFPSKLAIREHWAVSHVDQKLPEVYKKPPKPKEKIPGKGIYVCQLCPEVDGKKPTFAWPSSLVKHRKHYHSSKPMPSRCWKYKSGGVSRYRSVLSRPRTKVSFTSRNVRTRKTKKDSDEEEELSSSSGSGSDSEEFNSSNEAEQTKQNSLEPVRRSARRTRGDTKHLLRLLKESESEIEEEDETPKASNLKQTVARRKTKTVANIKVSKVTPTSSTPPTCTGPAPRKTKIASKFTKSYINTLLDGKQLCLILTRIDQDSNANAESPVNLKSRNQQVAVKATRGRSRGHLRKFET